MQLLVCGALVRIPLENRIAIVGNAASLKEHSYGEDIDRHLAVVRMNNAFPMPEMNCHIGKKTYLAVIVPQSCFRKNIVAYFNRALEEFAVRFVLWTGPISLFKPEYKEVFKKVKLFFNPFRTSLVRAIPTPTTGIATIYWFIRQGLINLDIYGFDFFKSGEWQNTHKTNGKVSGPHKPSVEKAWFLEQLEKYPSIHWYN